MTINADLCSKLNILILTVMIDLTFIPKNALIDACHIDLSSLGLTLCNSMQS